MTRTQQAQKRFNQVADELRRNGWKVEVKATDGGESLTATSATEWYDRYQLVWFGYLAWTSEFTGAHTHSGGTFYAVANSASRKIDRRINAAEAIRIAHIYGNSHRVAS